MQTQEYLKTLKIIEDSIKEELRAFKEELTEAQIKLISFESARHAAFELYMEEKEKNVRLS